jgi:hypothetical protein
MIAGPTSSYSSLAIVVVLKVLNEANIDAPANRKQKKSQCRVKTRNENHSTCDR